MEAWLQEQKINSDGIAEAIDDFGAVDPSDLVELDDDDLEQLCSQMKKLEAKRFRSAVVAMRSPSTPVGSVDAGAVLSARGDNFWDVFLSHNQAEGGQQTDLIATSLANLGLKPWFDQWGNRAF